MIKFFSLLWPLVALQSASLNVQVGPILVAIGQANPLAFGSSEKGESELVPGLDELVWCKQKAL